MWRWRKWTNKYLDKLIIGAGVLLLILIITGWANMAKSDNKLWFAFLFPICVFIITAFVIFAYDLMLFTQHWGKISAAFTIGSYFVTGWICMGISDQDNLKILLSVLSVPAFIFIASFLVDLAVYSFMEKYSEKQIMYIVKPWKKSTEFEELFLVNISGRYGYINRGGQIIIRPRFDIARNFSEGLANVMDRYKGRWGYVDSTGLFVTRIDFRYAEPFSEGLGFVGLWNNNNHGYVNRQGDVEIVLKPGVFSEKFSGGLARVCAEERWGYIDNQGYIAVDLQFDNAEDFSAGLARVKINDRWGYIDLTGSHIVEFQFDAARDFCEGLASVNIGDKWGYINVVGEYTVEPRFDYAGDFSEGLALVKKGRKYGYVDKAGTIIIGLRFDNVWDFSEGLAAVVINKKVGYIDKSGIIVISPQFDNARNFSEGLAAVEISRRYGYIDKTGDMVIHRQFDHAGDFCKGLAAVVHKMPGYSGDSRYIDKTGKCIWSQRATGEIS